MTLEKGAAYLHARAVSMPRKSIDCTKPWARLVNKDGAYHVDHLHPPASAKTVRHIFSFLLEIQWRWVIIGSAVCFPLTWLLFGAIYYVISHQHGDFQPHNEPNRTLCIQNVDGFLGVLQFSIESQQTIGYGFRYPNTDCYWTLITLGVQYVAGAVLQCCICGIVWARLIRPKHRGREVIFSTKAVIAQNDKGQLCLQFRLSDIAGSHLVSLTVRMYMAKKTTMAGTGGALFSFRLLNMNLCQETGGDHIFLLWPTILTHIIDTESPLYEHSLDEMLMDDFEIIVVVEGVAETNSMAVQARTSYLPEEIMWGHKFQPMNLIGKDKRVKIDYQQFDKTYPVSTPNDSAKNLQQLQGKPKEVSLKESFLLRNF